MLEVINVQHKDDGLADYCFKGRKHYWEMRKYLGWEPIIGYLAFMGGSILFNINCSLGYCTTLTPDQTTWFVWFPAVLGCILFVLGSALECYHNRVWYFKPCNLTHWVSVLNFLGSLAFLFAALCGMFGVENELWLVSFPYTLGSGFFLIAAF